MSNNTNELYSKKGEKNEDDKLAIGFEYRFSSILLFLDSF